MAGAEFTQDTKDKINAIHQAIYGNGRPKDSFVHRIARLETLLAVDFALVIGIVTRLVYVAIAR